MRGRWLVAATAVLSVIAGAAVIFIQLYRSSPEVSAAPLGGSSMSAPTIESLVFDRLDRPARTAVKNAAGESLAIFTDGARTVRLTGPVRAFKEPRHTRATVNTDAWVRLAPKIWHEGAESADWFRPWLDKALTDRSPDALAVAMQYIYGAEKVMDSEGLQIAGDASFGPLSDTDPDGRAENSDFYDYLGVPWSFSDGKKEKPDPTKLRSLDCSGFLRMVYGYRLGHPLRGTNTAGEGLPRRAYAMAGFGPGKLLIPNRGRPVRDYDLLQAGDLLFFTAGPVLGTNIEHAGIYLGVDDSGHYRFISSRVTANGPTLGDFGGDSLLDGPGYWSFRFRTARRL